MVHPGLYAQKVFTLSYNLIVAHWQQEDKLGTQEATTHKEMFSWGIKQLLSHKHSLLCFLMF